MADSNEMTINLVVLGRTQAGKSAAGNSLLGSSDFESRLSPSSVTTRCSLGRSCRILGIIRRNACEFSLRIRVLDTPSYPHSGLSREQVTVAVEELTATANYRSAAENLNTGSQFSSHSQLHHHIAECLGLDGMSKAHPAQSPHWSRNTQMRLHRKVSRRV
ncbi:GTPase IMAP family member GIMD1 isoform X2 [Patagioenas fasciata]|uniref:GTPase IMAP family member GIMD1 isoform X2 n=1 Tax=Patagioenas fasciata TaxID=372321 RepID=UPI003A9A4E58